VVKRTGSKEEESKMFAVMRYESWPMTNHFCASLHIGTWTRRKVNIILSSDNPQMKIIITSLKTTSNIFQH